MTTTSSDLGPVLQEMGRVCPLAPICSDYYNHGGLLVAPRSVAGSTVAYVTLQTERHLWYCERWFQLPWCDQPALKRVCIGQAAFHSTGLASASRSSADGR